MIKPISKAFPTSPKIVLLMVAYLLQLAFFQTLMAADNITDKGAYTHFAIGHNSKNNHRPATTADYRMQLKHEEANKQSTLVHPLLTLNPGVIALLSVTESPKPDLRFHEVSLCISDDAYQRYRLLRVFLI